MSTTSVTIHESATPSRFFTYPQNNSGGRFVIDATKGIAKYVIIEAHSARQANALAEAVGLYFGGAGDCPCCGDRWYDVDDSDGYAVPSIYGKPITEGWNSYTRDAIAVHHHDGTMLWYERSNGQETIPE